MLAYNGYNKLEVVSLVNIIEFYVAHQVHVAVEDFADWKTALLYLHHLDMPTNRALWPARRSTNSPAISLEIDLAHLNVARFFHESPLPPKQLGKGHIGVMTWNW